MTEFKAVRDLGGFDCAKPTSIRQSLRHLQQQLSSLSGLGAATFMRPVSEPAGADTGTGTEDQQQPEQRPKQQPERQYNTPGGGTRSVADLARGGYTPQVRRKLRPCTCLACVAHRVQWHLLVKLTPLLLVLLFAAVVCCCCFAAIACAGSALPELMAA